MSSEEKIKKNRILSPLIPLALIFFILPNYEIIDFMPDLFGFLMLYFALEKIAEFDDRTEKARKLMLWFSLISAIRFFVIFTTHTFSSTSDTMTVVSIFAVTEGILFFVVASNFFDGLSYTLTRNESINGLKTVSDAKFITMLFGFTKIALNLLPTLIAIIEVDKYNSESTQFFQDLTQIQSLVTLLCITISLFFGVYWFSVMFKFYKTIKNDNAFIDFVSDRYENEIGKNTKYIARKHYKVAKFIGLLSIVFLFTVQIDGQLLMPEFVAGLLLVGVMYVLNASYKKYTGNSLQTINISIYISTILLSVMQAIAYFYRLTLSMEVYVFLKQNEKLFLALFSASIGVLLAYIWLNLQQAFKETEEKLFDVDLTNRYKWQMYSGMTFIILRTITLAAQPAREYLGGFEIVFLITWIVLYLWYLKKEEN